MINKKFLSLLAGGVLGLTVLAACGSSDDASTDDAETCTETTTVKITLQWVVQAQFAGNFVAKDLGYYDQECIDLQIQPGGPDINAVQLLLTGDTDLAGIQFGSVLTSREAGRMSSPLAKSLNEALTRSFRSPTRESIHLTTLRASQSGSGAVSCHHSRRWLASTTWYKTRTSPPSTRALMCFR